MALKKASPVWQPPPDHEVLTILLGLTEAQAEAIGRGELQEDVWRLVQRIVREEHPVIRGDVGAKLRGCVVAAPSGKPKGAARNVGKRGISTSGNGARGVVSGTSSGLRGAS